MSAVTGVLAACWWIVPAALVLVAAAALLAWSATAVTGRRVALVLLASAADPGNAPHRVELIGRRGRGDDGRRWVRVVNGTAPHTRYRISVAAGSVDPIAAIAATYGLSAEDYRTCAKRS